MDNANLKEKKRKRIIYNNNNNNISTVQERRGVKAMSSLVMGMSEQQARAALVVLISYCFCVAACASTSIPKPREWPHQFHSILMMNYSGELQIIDLWYDWTNGRNFNIIQKQLDPNVVYDLEWNNGTSFYYTLPSNSNSNSDSDYTPYCSSAQLQVGILRPNWLDGANYIGQRHLDGFLCNVWEKVEFLWYYEDVVTRRPVHWLFYTGISAAQ